MRTISNWLIIFQMIFAPWAQAMAGQGNGSRQMPIRKTYNYSNSKNGYRNPPGSGRKGIKNTPPPPLKQMSAVPDGKWPVKSTRKQPFITVDTQELKKYLGDLKWGAQNYWKDLAHPSREKLEAMAAQIAQGKSKGRVADQLVEGGYLKLLYGMGASELFWAITSNDPNNIYEFIASLFGPDFHLSMMMFEGSIKLSKTTLTAAAMGDKAAMAYLHRFVMPLADIVNNFASEFWSHPKFVAYRAAWSPWTKVVDPAHPGSAPTTDLDARLRYRQLMRLEIMSDVLKSMNDPLNTAFTEKNFDLLWHGMEMLLVQEGQGLASQMIVPVKLVADKARSKTHIIAIPLNRIDAVALEGGEMRAIGVIRSVNLGLLNDGVANLLKRPVIANVIGDSAAKKIGQSAIGKAIGLEATGAEVLGGAIFFIALHALDIATRPYRDSQFRMEDVAAAKSELEWAMEWYLNPLRKNNIPWGIYGRNHLEKVDLNGVWNWKNRVMEGFGENDYQWLRFFQEGFNPDNKDPRIPQSAKRAADPFSVEFTANTDYWHDDGLGIWQQAHDFIKKFHHFYLNEDIHEGDWDWMQCVNFLKADDTKCEQDWFYKYRGKFVQTVQNYTPERFVQSKLDQFNKALGRYRDQILLGEVLAKYNQWTANMEEKVKDERNKESYFMWIARGMDMHDPQFIENDQQGSAWHADPSSDIFFNLEIIKMLVLYDQEVLGKGLTVSSKIWNMIENLPIQPPSAKLFNSEYLKTIDAQWKLDIRSFVAKVSPFIQCLPSITSLVSASSCPGQVLEQIQKEHRENIAEFLTQNRQQLSKHSLLPLFQEGFPLAFHTRVDKNPEEAESRRQMIPDVLNPKLFKNLDEQQKLNTIVDQETRIVRWLYSGMKTSLNPQKGDADFLKNEGAWRPEDAAENPRHLAQWNNVVVDKLVTRPFFQGTLNNKVQCPEDQMCGDEALLTQDLMSLLRGEYSQISDYGRDRLVMVAHTKQALQKDHDKLAEVLEHLNNAYVPVLNAAANPKIVSHLGRTLVEIFFPIYNYIGGPDKANNVFTRAGTSGFLTLDDAKSLPAGVINTYNAELLAYLGYLSKILAPVNEDRKKITGLADQAAQIAQTNKKLPENKVQKVPDAIALDREAMDGLQVLMSALELVIPANTSATPLSLMGKSTAIAGQFGVMFCLLPELHGKLCDVISQGVFSRLNDTLAATWVGVEPLLESKDFFKAQQNLVRLRNELGFNFSARVNYLTNYLITNKTGMSTPGREERIHTNLVAEKFAIPLLASTVGQDTRETKLAYLLTSFMVGIENQKQLHTRLGCYMLDRNICPNH